MLIDTSIVKNHDLKDVVQWPSKNENGWRILHTSVIRSLIFDMVGSWPHLAFTLGLLYWFQLDPSPHTKLPNRLKPWYSGLWWDCRLKSTPTKSAMLVEQLIGFLPSTLNEYFYILPLLIINFWWLAPSNCWFAEKHPRQNHSLGPPPFHENHHPSW